MQRATFLLVGLAVSLPAVANTITVTSKNDWVGDGACSLREAIVNANNGATYADCAAGAAGMDVLDFAPALYDSSPVSLSGTAVTEPVTIDGPGVFLLAIFGLTFQSGASGSIIEDIKLGGEGVRSEGADLTLTRVRVVKNSNFMTQGGGIAVTDANLTVSDSEISGNMVFDAFSVYSHFGGGIGFLVGTPGTRTLTLTNVTLSTNYAGTSGGGLAVRVAAAGASAVVNLTHVTLAANHAGTSGGGIYLEPGAGSITAHLKHIVSGENTTPPGSPSDIFESSDTALTLERSVIESANGFAPDTSDGSLVGSDSGLSGLGCNGSTQRTHALQFSSPAIDFIPAVNCNTLLGDQRGSPRPVDGNGDNVADCDAGALEDQGPGDFSSSFYTITPCRLVDTRGQGSPETPFGGPALSFPAFDDRQFNIAGRCGVPGSAAALAINVTTTNATRGGTLHLFDPEVRRLSTPFLRFLPGKTRSNNGIIPFCTDIGIVEALASFDYQGNYYGSVDLILDIVGYFE